jgi:hypothetical protein
VLEKHILQREQKSDVPASLTTIAYSAVGSIALALLALLGWSLTRLGRKSGPDAPRRQRRTARRIAAAGSA